MCICLRTYPDNLDRLICGSVKKVMLTIITPFVSYKSNLHISLRIYPDNLDRLIYGSMKKVKLTVTPFVSYLQ